MLNVTQVKVGELTLTEAVKNLDYYYAIIPDDWNSLVGNHYKIEKLSLEALSKYKDNLSVVMIKADEDRESLKTKSIDDIQNDPKYAEIFEDKQPKDIKKEPKYAKYFSPVTNEKKVNQAPYAKMLSNMNGTVWIIPKSNGCIRVEFNDKSKAEVYLKKFKQNLLYRTNSVEAYNVLQFYDHLGIVYPEEVANIAKNYEWLTVDSIAKLTWVSESVTKSVDREAYGFCITKRAIKVK